MINSYPEVRAFGRKIPDDIVRKATAVFFISIILNFTAITLLCITEDFELKDIMFETVSAFGTVGLSYWNNTVSVKIRKNNNYFTYVCWKTWSCNFSNSNKQTI